MSRELIRMFLIFGPIVLLFGVGLSVTLRSGVYSVASVDGMRKVGGNLTRTIVLTAGCLVAMAALQQLVGFRMMSAW
jgi:hypothetical protein